MAYSSNGRKPMERASKISHTEIINNSAVQAFLESCILPGLSDLSEITAMTVPIVRTDGGEHKIIVALDGGYTETFVRDDFPSSSLTFFNFGPLLFKLDDLNALDTQDFIDPRDFAKLKQFQRYPPLVLPTRNISLKNSDTLTLSVRKTLRDYFEARDADRERLMDSLRWLVFQEWQGEGVSWALAQCPYKGCMGKDITFTRSRGNEIPCDFCGKPVWLTDTFRLHEVIDDEQGAGGILGYLMVLLEQMVLVQWIRAVWLVKPSLLGEILFVKDGPLAFFGQTANFHKPMRALMNYLLRPNSKNAKIRLVGVEKSGAFVDHAAAIQSKMDNGTLLIPSNEYIYKYIIPSGTTTLQYGRSTYYGWKVMFKDWDGAMYVLTLPTTEYLNRPSQSDFPDLADVLSTVSRLKCHMYENALIPVALVNKLVSLSDVPSSQILKAFAKNTLS